MTDNATAPGTEVTGAQSLVRSLEHAGVDVVFGIPGGAILPAYDPLMDSTEGPAHPRPPRAGRRPRRRGLRGRRPAGSASAWRPPGRARPTSSRRSPTPTWTRCRSSRSPARSPSAAIGTDAFQEADIRGITMPITKHNFLVTDPRRHPARDRRGVPHRRHRAPRPGPGRHRQGRPAGRAPPSTWPDDDRPAGLPPGHPPARQAGPGGGPADRRGRVVRCSTSAAASSARRRQRRAARARRADRHPRRHHADGPRRVPRQPPAAPGHARHARHGRGRRRAAEVRPAHHARRPLRRPGHRQVCDRSRPHAKVIHADIDPAEISQEPRRRRPDRGRRQGGHRRADRRAARPSTTPGETGRLRRLVGAASTVWRDDVPARLRRARRRLARAAVRHRAARRRSPARTRSTPPASASTRCGPRSSSATRTRRPG